MLTRATAAAEAAAAAETLLLLSRGGDARSAPLDNTLAKKKNGRDPGAAR